MLIDSNIIIYAAKPEYPQLRKFIAEHTPAVSAVSYVEVLGYHKRKMTLGDALVAGTALAHHLTLFTRNTKDFDWIENLTLLDPLASDEDAV